MYKLSLKPISQYNMIYYDIYYKYKLFKNLRTILKLPNVLTYKHNFFFSLLPRYFICIIQAFIFCI